MKKSLKNGLWILMAGSGLLFSCHKDLNLTPTNEGSANYVYRDADGYKLALSRVYSAMAVTGNSGPAGDPDVPLGGDEGFSDFFRGFWNMQELTTDEAVVAWGDAGLPDFHNMSWTPNNGFIQRGYNRSYFQITLCNEFIRESDPAKLTERGINDQAQRAAIAFYREEARFLRAFQYWVLLDLFRNVPLVTEKDLVGTTLPKSETPENLFNYIEKELQILETSLLPSPATGATYGRATRGAAQALLARLYLNAETYLGEGRGKYDKALEYAEKVIKTSGHSISQANDYHRMMSANNNSLPMSSEFIFTINYDGLRTKGYGGTHYFVHASIGGTMNARMWGADGGWAGLRTTRNIPLLFPDTGRFGDNGADRRAMFFTTGQALEINNITTFQEGYAVTKYRNVVMNSIGNSDSLAYSRDSIYFRTTTAGMRKGEFIKIDRAPEWFLNGTYAIAHITRSGNDFWLVKVKSIRRLPDQGVATGQATVFRLGKGNDPDQAFIDIDMPVFRLAEMYLIYAEAHLRGGGGNLGTAKDYINILRERAYGNNTSGAITEADLNLNFILDERGRELYWEGHRRTDLIRYKRFTEGEYLWPWKGGVAGGRGVNPDLKIFPIPLAEITANPNLKQNPGY